MKTPRCGLNDRVANFVQEGSTWQKRELTFRISKYPSSSSLSKEDVDLQVRKAVSLWQEASELRFEERSTGSVDIDIRFELSRHGDGIPFDGPEDSWHMHSIQVMAVMFMWMILKTGVSLLM
eukprot:TRINITY_DN29207_c0_g1_i1.p2 TRINITY_DN29207_c0_g1~~TRINITY_DN29207_c0_g1_i1.p2  ORF type:complete len:122 (-),score=26.68 TRINITY_DN29207_c0_g1_i1:285-650(-)